MYTRPWHRIRVFRRPDVRQVVDCYIWATSPPARPGCELSVLSAKAFPRWPRPAAKRLSCKPIAFAGCMPSSHAPAPTRAQKSSVFDNWILLSAQDRPDRNARRSPIRRREPAPAVNAGLFPTCNSFVTAGVCNPPAGPHLTESKSRRAPCSHSLPLRETPIHLMTAGQSSNTPIVTVEGVRYVIKVGGTKWSSARSQYTEWYVVAFACDLGGQNAPLAGPFGTKSEAVDALASDQAQPLIDRLVKALERPDPIAN